MNPIMGSSTARFERSIPAVNPNSYYLKKYTLSVELVEYSYNPQIIWKQKTYQDQGDRYGRHTYMHSDGGT